MAVQDGLQASGTITPTSSGLAIPFGIRASNFQIVASSTSTCFVDVTSGASVLATTSNGYPMSSLEVLKVPIGGGQPRMPGYYSGFSVLATPGTTATLRYIALR